MNKSQNKQKKMEYTVSIVPGEKFSRKTWLTIEQNQHNEHNNSVIIAVINHKEIEQKNESCRLSSLPIDFYNHVYQSIIINDKTKKSTLKPIEENKKKKGKSSVSSTYIRQHKNSISKINGIIDNIKIDIKNKKLNPFLYIKHEIIEIRAIILMHLLNTVNTNTGELDIIVQKFIKVSNNNCKHFIDPVRTKNIEPDAIKHLTEELTKFRTKFTFDGVSLALSNPKIFWTTKYDMCLPNPPIRCRKNQQQTLNAIDEVKGNEDSFLIVNRSPPGSGKSTLLVPIIKMYNKNRTTYVCAGQGKTGVIQFMQALYAASIPFANIFIDSKKNLITDYQHSVKDKTKCNVFIGTPDAIIAALKLEKLRDTTREEKFSGWIIVDEPTYGADIADSPACNQLMELIHSIPENAKHLILLSATLPDLTLLPSITSNYNSKYQISGSNDSIQLTCDLVSDTGFKMMPHHDTLDSKVFKTIADKVKINPFLARFYSASNLIEMSNHIKCPIPLNNADDFKPENIKNLSINLLEQLSVTPPATPMEKIPYKSSISPYMTMIVTTKPTEYALEKYSDIIAELKTVYGSANKIYQNYLKLVKQNEKELEIKNRQKKSADQEQHDDPQVIDLGFANEFQVNTKAYCQKHGITMEKYREYVNISLIQNTDETDELQLLLMAGIGVLSSEPVSDLYKDQVMNLMTDGRLAYVITDHTGCYGVNMMVNTVIIERDFAAIASIATIEQAGGRLCRIGLTYSGTLILPEFKINEMFKEIRNPNIVHTAEAINMENAYQKLN